MALRGLEAVALEVVHGRAIKAWGRWLNVEYKMGDPYDDLHYVQQPKPKPQRTATQADVDALISTCGEDVRSMRDVAIILALANTGARLSEIARMRWSDLDFDGVLTIPETKGGRAVVRSDSTGT